MKSRLLLVLVTVFLAASLPLSAEIKPVVERNRGDDATPAFHFSHVPAPSQNDAATKAEFILVDGRKDRNGGDLDKLHDGKVPAEEDQPSENFFFNAGSEGGRLLIDLDRVIEVKQVNTYSWHPRERGPQFYKLYASDGRADNFSAQPKKRTDPLSCGWKFIANVDTRRALPDAEPGGQYGVGVSNSEGPLGQYRYLLFDVSRTDDQDVFGHTFFSEIDVVDRSTPPVAVAVPKAVPPRTVEAEGGKYRLSIDTSAAPDLTEWADQELVPVLREWYPKIVKLLPSPGFEAPTRVTIRFREGMGGTPAATGGSRISCNAGWFRRNLKGEAKGAVVHEMVHVVQQYGRARRNNRNATRTPGWLVEGIPDYIRWFLYEPETKGAEITRRNLARARYDGNYRITGNFLNWVTGKYDPEIVPKLNMAAREGRYQEDLWKEYTGKTVQELGAEWKGFHEKRLETASTAKD
jgi:Peptidase of plants and bacteria